MSKNAPDNSGVWPMLFEKFQWPPVQGIDHPHVLKHQQMDVLVVPAVQFPSYLSSCKMSPLLFSNQEVVMGMWALPSHCFHGMLLHKVGPSQILVCHQKKTL
jgi:hypothetical protein